MGDSLARSCHRLIIGLTGYRARPVIFRAPALCQLFSLLQLGLSPSFPRPTYTSRPCLAGCHAWHCPPIPGAVLRSQLLHANSSMSLCSSVCAANVHADCPNTPNGTWHHGTGLEAPHQNQGGKTSRHQRSHKGPSTFADSETVGESCESSNISKRVHTLYIVPRSHSPRKSVNQSQLRGRARAVLLVSALSVMPTWGLFSITFLFRTDISFLVVFPMVMPWF